MNLSIISPTESKNMEISWLELNTPEGNFVIQPGHAPLIITLSENSQVTVCLTNGKKESINLTRGIATISRTSATLIINTNESTL